MPSSSVRAANYTLLMASPRTDLEVDPQVGWILCAASGRLLG